MMKYRCPDCGEIFEGQLDKCPNCGKEFSYAKKKEVKERPERNSGNPFLGVAIASIVISVLTMTIYPVLLLNLREFAASLMNGLFTTMVPGLWDSIVREFFTFLFFIFIVFFLVQAVIILVVVIFALGPLGFIIALILSIIAFARVRKWYSILAFCLAITNIILDVVLIALVVQAMSQI